MAAMVVFSAAMALFAGAAPPGNVSLALLLGACAGMVGVAPLLDATAFLRLAAVGMALAATLVAVTARRFIWRPRDAVERALGLAVAALVGSGWLRAALCFTTDGVPPRHLLLLPDWLIPPYAVLYGMLPILVATLLLSLVNARLRQHLNLRATTDELTGALTRRALRELGPAMLERERRARRGVALLMLDLDHFKAINDRFGHASGDLVLQRIGALLRTQLRPEALLARYGGEEFVALVPVDDLRIARQVAERLREATTSTAWLSVDGRPMSVTLSVGVALLGEQEALDAALQRADEALYRAKNDGRNQVQVAIAAA
jgi:diguanylate cyclase (GGDEF)-like protein